MNEVGREGSRFLLESWLDFGEIVERRPELRQILFDPVTGFPTTPLLFPRIASLLEERGEATLLCITVVRYARIEEIYGWRAFDELMREIADTLDVIAGDSLRDSDVIAELMNCGNAFVIVLSPPRMQACIDPSARVDLVRRIEAILKEKLSLRLEPAILSKFGCYVGAATICNDEDARIERLVFDGLSDALADAHDHELADAAERVAGLRDLLAGGHIRTLLHPVLNLQTDEIVGYEALSRGPEGSEFEHPDKLFAVAYDADLVMRLERLCRTRALESATRMPEGAMLFLNIEPESVSDPQFREAVDPDLCDPCIDATRVVLEITERIAISDYQKFRGILDYVRALGFGVAVDDAGAGYGSLQCLAESKPDWLKIDMAVVRGCDSDEVKASLIKSLVVFSEQVGSRLVAEGIETEDERGMLKSLGVRYGQGYLLAMPSPDFVVDVTGADSSASE